MAAKVKTPTQGDGGMRLDDLDDYRESKERLESLQARKTQLDAKLLELMDEGRKREATMKSVDAAARAILAGKDFDQAELLDRESFRALERESAAVNRAVELAAAEYEAAWKGASAAVIAARIDEHKEIVCEIAEHLDNLCAAITREQAWVASLRNNGLYFQCGLGGTCNPAGPESAMLFTLLRRLNVDGYRRRLKRHNYL